MFNLDYSEEEIIDDVQMYDPRDEQNQYELPIKYAIDELDQFCLYTISTNVDAITHSALSNMKTMFEMLDEKPYKANDLAKGRLEFIKLGLEARTTLNLTSRPLVKQFIEQNCDTKLKDTIDSIIKQTNNQKINNDTAKYINTMVFDNLSNGWSLAAEKKLGKLFKRRNAGEYSRLSDYITDLNNIIDEVHNGIKKAEEYKRDGKGFDLDEDNIVSEVSSIMNELNAPTNKLRTGLQYLNKMLNGGFESGRSYIFSGISGVGKSVILLSCALWIIKYNNIPVVDNKKNAVLFISQENSKSETFERIFNINVSGEDIRNFSDSQIIDGLKNAGFLNSKKDLKTTSFIFKYYSDKEIGVQDIDALINDYDRKDIRIIAVVQDYVEKLKPRFQYTELRHSLGCVATEMAECAKAHQIPFISAAQLNRTAASVVSDNVTNNKTNAIKLLGKANVSESWDLIKNTDVFIVINRETDDTQEGHPQYLGFKLEKFRGKPNKDGIFMFIHPFDENNPILLVPDINGKPLSKLSIEDFNPLGRREVKVYKPGEITKEDNEISSGFLDFCSSLSDNENDEFDNYVDMCKYAEQSIQSQIKELEEREEQIRNQRKKEIKNLKLDTTPDGLIKIMKSDVVNALWNK